MKRNVIGLTLLLALISTGCEDDSNKDLNINYSLPKLLEEIIFETIDGVEKERKRTYHWMEILEHGIIEIQADMEMRHQMFNK